MRDDPGFDTEKIAASLDAHYGIQAGRISFLPIGHDMNTSVYTIVGVDGTSYFLKIRTGPVYMPGLYVTRALIEKGIHAVLAPLRTCSAALWAPLDGYEGRATVLYPFVDGENASVAGLSEEQWREFGATLRAIHGSRLEDRFRNMLRIEDFALPSAALVRQLLALVDRATFDSVAATQFAEFWREHAERICWLLNRAEQLGASLQSKSFDMVLCHSDIHAANILIGDDGRIWLVDWDAPVFAPRERDLLFVIGSRIARTVTPEEEILFFEGYGPMEVDPEALAYYRYERIVEDLGEFGRFVFLAQDASEASREQEASLGRGFFAVSGDIDRAETVPRRRW